MATHQWSWAKHAVITDPAHVTTAARLRRHYTADQQRRSATRRHTDGHRVALRALPDYDALFGIDDFTSAPTKARSE